MYKVNRKVSYIFWLQLFPIYVGHVQGLWASVCTVCMYALKFHCISLFKWSWFLRDFLFFSLSDFLVVHCNLCSVNFVNFTFPIVWITFAHMLLLFRKLWARYIYRVTMVIFVKEEWIRLEDRKKWYDVSPINRSEKKKY